MPWNWKKEGRWGGAGQKLWGNLRKRKASALKVLRTRGLHTHHTWAHMDRHAWEHTGHMHIHRYIGTYMNKCTHAQRCICTQVCPDIQMLTHASVCTGNTIKCTVYICTYVMNKCTLVCAHAQTHAIMCIYTSIVVYVPPSLSPEPLCSHMQGRELLPWSHLQ